MRVIYVAGKYRAETKEGIEANIQKARHAAIKLWQLGWAVITLNALSLRRIKERRKQNSHESSET